MNKSGRLAFRVEGTMWNCYYALPDTMQDAIYLGSLHMTIARNLKHKKAFMNIMRNSLNEFFKDQNLIVDHWKTETAPEHERTRE
jgi:hypothetical protein